MAIRHIITLGLVAIGIILLALEVAHYATDGAIGPDRPGLPMLPFALAAIIETGHMVFSAISEIVQQRKGKGITADRPSPIIRTWPKKYRATKVAYWLAQIALLGFLTFCFLWGAPTGVSQFAIIGEVGKTIVPMINHTAHQPSWMNPNFIAVSLTLQWGVALVANLAPRQDFDTIVQAFRDARIDHQKNNDKGNPEHKILLNNAIFTLPAMFFSIYVAYFGIYFDGHLLNFHYFDHELIDIILWYLAILFNSLIINLCVSTCTDVWLQYRIFAASRQNKTEHA